MANPDLPWDWKDLSYSPSIRIDHILANPDKPWNWDYLSQQDFMLDVSSDIRRHFAARKIQRAWLKASYYTPEHPICQRRLEREFNQLAVTHGIW